MQHLTACSISCSMSSTAALTKLLYSALCLNPGHTAGEGDLLKPAPDAPTEAALRTARPLPNTPKGLSHHRRT